MKDKENNIMQNEESKENKKLIVKGKELFKKYKNEIYIVAGIVLLTNGMTGKIVGDIQRSKGIDEGKNLVLSNASMLGKGLRAFRKS